MEQIVETVKIGRKKYIITNFEIRTDFGYTVWKNSMQLPNMIKSNVLTIEAARLICAAHAEKV